MSIDAEYADLLRQYLAAPTEQLRELLHNRYQALALGDTTSAGLPFPDPADPVAAGADAIRALAEAIDPLVARTGWIDLTLQSGFTGTASYIRAGQVVQLSYDISGEVIGDTQLTGTLPVDVRPSGTSILVMPTYFDPAATRGTAVAYIAAASGVLRATAGSSTSVTRLRGAGMWISPPEGT